MKEKEAIAAITGILLKKDAIDNLAQREGFTEALTKALTDALYPKSGLFRTRTAILPDMENHLQPLADSISLKDFSINGNAMSAANKLQLPPAIQLDVAGYLQKLKKDARAAAPAAASSAPAFQQSAAAAASSREEEKFISFEKPAAKPKEVTAVSRLNAERAANKNAPKGNAYGTFQ